MNSNKSWMPFGTDIETGRYSSSDPDGFDGEMRRGFMQKVFGILSLQLLVTVGIGSVIMGVSSVRNWISDNGWVLLLVLVAAFGFLIVLSCVPEMMNRHPQNLILLFAFTACEGVLLGVVSASYDFDEVLLAVGITVGVTFGLTLFALQTKWDFTVLSGALFSCLVVLVLMSFVFIFFPSNGIGATIFASLGALLFSVYLIYDVQLIAGGGKYELGPDDYVPAALAVYLDIINLFLFILRLVGNRN